MRPAAVVIPGSDWRVKVVIRLAVVCAVVTSCPQILGKTLHIRRRNALATHEVRADRRRMHPRKQSRTTRGTNAGMREGSRESRALLGEPIDVRRDRLDVTVATEIGTDVFETNPEDVRAGFRVGNRRE